MTALRRPLCRWARGARLTLSCAIHHQFYQDLFDWAGRLREVNLYLGDTPFRHFARIEEEECPDAGPEQEDYLRACRAIPSSNA